MNNAAQLQQPRQPSQQQPTVELEFNQAMMDFKTMFPEVEAQVIEAVLRANDGVVDATIDQLLTMTSDSQKKEASPVNFTPSDPEELPLRVLRNWNPPLLGPLPHDFLRIRVPRLHQSQRQALTLLAGNQLKERLAENERQRGATTDPSEVQLLNDERLAIFLQNEEFMRELSSNREFLEALELDSPSASKSSSHSSGKDDLEAFRERLRNMGKTSKKKFAQLARMFHIKRRGGAYMSHGSAPSKDHLLLTSEPLMDDDELDYDRDDFPKGSHNPQGSHVDPSPARRPQGGGKFEPL